MVEAYTRGSVPAPGIRTKVGVPSVSQLGAGGVRACLNTRQRMAAWSLDCCRAPTEARLVSCVGFEGRLDSSGSHRHCGSTRLARSAPAGFPGRDGHLEPA